jgi:tetratricopeptide (TPR) repeat protein
MTQPNPKFPFWSKIIKELEFVRKSKPYKDLKTHFKKLWSPFLFIFIIFTKITIIKDPRFHLFVNFFVIVACLLFDRFLWQILRFKFLKFLSISIITVSLFVWVGINSWENFQRIQGIIFPPAKSGEFLIVVAQFDNRGEKGLDPTTRIVQRLKLEIEKAEIDNTRIETVPKISDSETAHRIGKIHKALFVIWGWYDDAGFNPKFAITHEYQQLVGEVTLDEIPSELPEFNIYIREGLPGEMTFLVTSIIGQLYYQRNEYEKALHTFDVALENLKQSYLITKKRMIEGIDIIYFYYGKIYCKLKKFNKAITNFTTATELNPTNIYAYFSRGNTYKSIGNFDQAIADYNEVIKIDSAYAFAYCNRGVVYKIKGNLNQAIADYNEAIRLDSTDAAFYNNRGNAYNDKGNLDQAIADYTKAIELAPTYASAYYNRGNTYIDKGNLEQAIADYTKAIELVPTYAGAYSNRGHVYMNKGNLDQAIADYTKAIELAPTYSIAYSNRCAAFRNKGNFDRAIADGSKAIELDSADASAYNNRGNAYNDKGNLDQAIADYTKAIELAPTYAGAYHNRGNVYKDKGNLEQSLIDCNKAIELDPTYAGAYSNRAFVYKEKGNLEQSLIDCNKAIELDPTNASYYYNRGKVYKEKGNLDQAIADFTKAIELDSAYADAYFNRGIIYVKKNLKAQAISDLTTFLRLVPNTPDKSVIEKLIHDLKKDHFSYSNNSNFLFYQNQINFTPKILHPLTSQHSNDTILIASLSHSSTNK